MRIAVLSNSTMQPLSPLLADHDVVVGGVADLLQWLVDPGAPSAAPETEAVVICPDGDSLLPPIGAPGLLDELQDHIDRFAKTHPAKYVIVMTLLADHRSASSHADPSLPSGRFALRAGFESRLAELCVRNQNLIVLDMGELAERYGRENMITDSYWYLGRIRFSSLGFAVVAEELGRILDSVVKPPKKVAVLDLDNTLWGGVIGEDGLGGIELGEDGIGKCYRDFQRHLRELRESGILLAVVSKNDSAIVDEVLDEHTMMVLRRSDFVSVSATWDNKADCIRSLAAELSLGLDAFVFIDDNPVERELVRRELPQVVVPEFPDQPEGLSRWFIEDVVPSCFSRVRILGEDARKTENYQARESRRNAEETDLDGFLNSLDIRLDFDADNPELIHRLSQLTQKTNQFNLTTQRLLPSDVAGLMSDPGLRVISCGYSDRFGDEGTIGLAIVDLHRGELTNLLLSCRVLGRGVEQRLLAEVERIVQSSGGVRLRAQFVATQRNAVAGALLENSGYHRLDTGDESWIGEKELR